MLFSSISRRRLLERAAAGAAFPAAGKAVELFGRKDPRILTQTYRHSDAIALAERSIRVEPILADQPGKPKPPDFAPFLAKSLEWAFPEAEILVGEPADAPAEALVRGSIELFHRLGSQGLRVKIALTLFDTGEGEELVLWRGAKRADWVRRFPTDDCMLTLADDFAAEWTSRR